MRHFLQTDSMDNENVLALLSKAADLKTQKQDHALDGKVMGMVFFNSSLRTRASFEVAMLKHGGHAICIEPGRGVWGFETRFGVVMDGDAAEHIAEAAPVLGRYADVLGVRAFAAGTSWAEASRDPVLHAFAECAGVPIINMEAARRHPCQELADALTLQEQLPNGTRNKKFVLSWCWHPKALPCAVPASASLAAARVGMDVTICHPPGFELDDGDLDAARRVASANGGSIQTTHDRDAAFDGADVIYAKSWGSLRHFGDAEAESHARSSHRDWIVDGDAMRRTRDGKGRFMHCLPIRRNVVATDEVLDGPWSVVTPQAENRLHVQRAVLLDLLGEQDE